MTTTVSFTTSGWNPPTIVHIASVLFLVVIELGLLYFAFLAHHLLTKLHDLGKVGR